MPNSRVQNLDTQKKISIPKWTFIGQKLKGSSYRVVFAKGWQFLLVSLGWGFGVRFRGVARVGFPVENKREGGWGGWGVG